MRFPPLRTTVKASLLFDGCSLFNLSLVLPCYCHIPGYIPGLTRTLHHSRAVDLLQTRRHLYVVGVVSWVLWRPRVGVRLDLPDGVYSLRRFLGVVDHLRAQFYLLVSCAAVWSKSAH